MTPRWRRGCLRGRRRPGCGSCPNGVRLDAKDRLISALAKGKNTADANGRPAMISARSPSQVSGACFVVDRQSRTPQKWRTLSLRGEDYGGQVNSTGDLKRAPDRGAGPLANTLH